MNKSIATGLIVGCLISTIVAFKTADETSSEYNSIYRDEFVENHQTTYHFALIFPVFLGGFGLGYLITESLISRHKN